ncbi:DUF2975 domain-containing protein [Emticicia agri]|uniref:DUF2975 domain-containing protein n=1 Tax=Emticicia agri TaxID=2492393 RepID=A0A4Q5M115_9BACT|nr:DUF2975 domain-containing protein [Emticicia agri]RYU95901.1 DUF2975 domain-containing protein [Emticicia agri]
MKTRAQLILSIARIIALVGYIGAIIHAIRLIVPYIIGFFTNKFPISTGTNLDHLRNNHHVFPYVLLMIFVITIAVIQIEIWDMLRKILREINLSSPFSTRVVSRVEKLSFTLFSLWLMHIIGDFWVNLFERAIGNINSNPFRTDLQFLFAAGIIFIVAQIFRRGVELQEENELTV